MSVKKTSFDPMEKLSNGEYKYLRKMPKGGALYMDVKFRQLWLVSDSPYNCIETELVEHVPGQSAVFKATAVVRDLVNDTLTTVRTGTGYGSETKGDFGDYLEKAETKAIGRALINVGFGTQFSGFDFDYEAGVRQLNADRPGRDKFDGVDSGVDEKAITKTLAERLKEASDKHGIDSVKNKANELFGIADSSKLRPEQLDQLARYFETLDA